MRHLTLGAYLQKAFADADCVQKQASIARMLPGYRLMSMLAPSLRTVGSGALSGSGIYLGLKGIQDAKNLTGELQQELSRPDSDPTITRKLATSAGLRSLLGLLGIIQGARGLRHLPNTYRGSMLKHRVLDSIAQGRAIGKSGGLVFDYASWKARQEILKEMTGWGGWRARFRSPDALYEDAMALTTKNHPGLRDSLRKHIGPAYTNYRKHNPKTAFPSRLAKWQLPLLFMEGGALLADPIGTHLAKDLQDSAKEQIASRNFDDLQRMKQLAIQQRRANEANTNKEQSDV